MASEQASVEADHRGQRSPCRRASRRSTRRRPRQRRALRVKLSRFVELGDQIDDALWDVAQPVNEMVALLNEMHALGAAQPDHPSNSGSMARSASRAMLQEPAAALGSRLRVRATCAEPEEDIQGCGGRLARHDREQHRWQARRAKAAEGGMTRKLTNARRRSGDDAECRSGRALAIVSMRRRHAVATDVRAAVSPDDFSSSKIVKTNSCRSMTRSTNRRERHHRAAGPHGRVHRRVADRQPEPQPGRCRRLSSSTARTADRPLRICHQPSNKKGTSQ